MTRDEICQFVDKKLNETTIELSREVSLSFGSLNKLKDFSHWTIEAYTLRDAILSLAVPAERFYNSDAVLQGAPLAKGMQQIDFAIVDVENGIPASEIERRIKDAGVFAIRHALNDSGADVSFVFEDDLIKFKRGYPRANAIDYLRDVKGYAPQVLEGATLEGKEHINDKKRQGYAHRVKHNPIERHRVIFALKNPWLCDLGEELVTSQDAEKAWIKGYTSLCLEFGFKYDKESVAPGKVLPRWRGQKADQLEFPFIHAEGKLIDIFSLKTPEERKADEIADLWDADTLEPADVERLISDLASQRLKDIEVSAKLNDLQKRCKSLKASDLKKAYEERTKSTTEQRNFDLAEKLAERFAYVFSQDNKCWDELNEQFCLISSVDLMFGHLTEKPSDILMRHDKDGRSKFDHVTFLPGEDRVTYDEKGRRLLNIWRPTTLQPSDEDATLFVDHLLYLFDENEEYTGHLLDWLACLAQRPTEKINWAPVITGKPGIGKDTIVDSIRPIIRSEYVSEVKTEELTDKYNGWASMRRLAVVSELYAEDRREVFNTLKQMFTAKNNRINEKYLKACEVPNVLNWIMFSNYPQALYIDKGDRRIFLYHSKAVAKPATYYEKYHRWLENGGYEAIYGYLLRRDISNFNPKAPAPMTADKEALEEFGAPLAEQQLKERYDAKQYPFNVKLATVVWLVEALKEDGISVSAPKLTQFLKEQGSKSLGQLTKGNSKLSAWLVHPEYAKEIEAIDKVADKFKEVNRTFTTTE